VVLGISFDKPAENKAFKEKFAFPFLLLSDPERKVGMAYGAADAPDAGHAKRISYLIDPQGKIAKVYPAVKPAEHPDQVLADLP
jgi:peroxiredoxin Q/BCP